MHPDTAAMIAHFGFERLPVESTLYRSTWRSSLETSGGGPAGTAMIGLLAEEPESVSVFHRLAFDETWHFYGGDPLLLTILSPEGSSRDVVMGGDPLRGQNVQVVVPAGHWFGAAMIPKGRYSLFGCTMAPGFTGGCFEAGSVEELVALYPAREAQIRHLCAAGSQRFMPAGFSP